MKICSAWHDEVCYDGRNCPVCDAINIRDERIYELNQEVESLTTDLEAARNDLYEQNS